MTALPPRAALALAVRLIEANGFALRADNERGDSFYLAPAGGERTLRVSNHRRTPKQRRGHPEVLVSLIVDGPRSARTIEQMVARALADFAAAAKRAGQDVLRG